jgi:hypothetical protein
MNFPGSVPALVVLALALISVPPARADVAILSPVRDNTLFEDANGDTSNGSGPGLFCGRISQGRARRALLAFDLDAALPPGAVIEGARLELHVSSSSDLTPRVLTLHRVLADWGEGASSSAGGGGAPAQPGDATWVHTFHPLSLWSVAGGDFVAAASASASVSGDGGGFVWSSNQLTSDVIGWLNGGTGNFGWLLMGDESQSNTARRCDSRESATVSYRPRLVISFVLPTPTLPASWGHVKFRYR